MATADETTAAQALAEHLRGVRHRQDGDLVAALAAQQRALSIEPHLPEAHYEVGAIRLERREFTEALESFRKAVASDPASAEAHVGLACASRHLGRFPDAVTACSDALRLRPAYAAAWEEQGIAYGHMRRHDLAAVSFREALALEPGNARVRAALGHACVILGDLAGAKAELQALEELDDTLATLLRTLIERSPGPTRLH